MAYNGPLPLLLLSSQTASSSATLTFTQISSLYSTYFMLFSNVVPASAGAVLQMLINTGSGFITSGYQSGINRNAYNSATFTNSNSTAAFLLSGPLSTTGGGAGQIYLQNVTNGGTIIIDGAVVMVDNATSNQFSSIIQGYNTATNITQLQVAMSTGNIATGTFSLYGVLE